MKNKKGISLIVLIVTIIVIIILAAAVILTLNKNNPIDSSRVAQVCENRDALNSAIQLYYGKKMAETEGVFSTSEIFLGGTATNTAGTAVTVPAIVGAALGTTNYHLVTDTGANNTEDAIGAKFPKFKDATWYVDVTTGLVYLTYTAKADMPTWMFEDENKTTINSSLGQFVKLVVSNNLADVQ